MTVATARVGGGARPVGPPAGLAIVLLFGLSLLTFVAGLNRQAITDADEAYYAESGREMVVSGDWITPHFNGEPRLQKPIFFYWLVASTYTVFGVGELQARLWAAAAGMGLSLVAFAVTRRWYGAGPDLVAGAIAATSLGVTMIGRMALPDMPLAFFVTVSVWCAVEAMGVAPLHAQAAQAMTPRPRAWLLLAALSTALGVITKGPVAIVLPMLIVGPIVWRASWRGRAGRALPLTFADIALALLLFVAVAAPWYVAATRANGLAYLKQFLIGENFDRFATARYNEPRPLWFFLPIIIGGLLPWSTYLLLWIAPAKDLLLRRRTLSPIEWTMGIWAVAPFLFFTASSGKQPRYILPCLVPIAIALADSLWGRTKSAGKRESLLLTGCACLSGAILMLVSGLVLRIQPILAGADPGWSAFPAFAIGAGGVAIVIAVVVAQPRALLAITTLAAAVAGLGLQASIFWLGRPEPVERVAARIIADGPPAAVCAWGAFERNLSFYTREPHLLGATDDDVAGVERFLSSSTPVFATVDSDLLATLEARTHRTFTRVLALPYLDTARLRLGSVVDPDPSGYLQRVVLITNH